MVDGNTIVLVKGASGSGKSTRVFLLLNYLAEIGERFIPYEYMSEKTGKLQTIGMYSSALNLIFLGKYYEKNGVKRWQGHDSVTGCFGGSAGMSKFLLDTSRRGHGVLIEGAGTTATWRLRPLELCGTSEFTNILYIVYDYRNDQYDDYIARIIHRTGKPPASDAMWHKHVTFQNEYEKAVQEGRLVNEAGGNVVLRNQLYDAPVWDFGKELLEFYGLHSEVPDFIAYCQNFHEKL